MFETRESPSTPIAPITFARLYRLAFREPGRAMQATLESGRPVSLGACSVAITSVTYLLVYFFLSQNGGRPTAFKPWLAIPAEVYYRYNLVLIVPSIALGWVSAAGFSHLIGSALGGRGTFEATLGTIGLGISLASWATGLHDVVTTFLGYLGLLNQRSYEDAMSTPGMPAHYLIWTLMVVYLVLFLWLFAVALAHAHKLRLSRAAIAGTVGVIVYQLVFVLFNR